MKYIYRVLFVFVVILAIAACQTQDIEEAVEYSAERGQSVIAFTDAVPVFRKNGIFWKYGATHAPVLSSPIAQKQANFELYEKKGLVVWTPNVGPVTTTSYAYFDAEIPDSVKVTPFINVDNTLYLMQSNPKDKLCKSPKTDDGKPANAEQADIKTLFKKYSKVNKRLFSYLGQSITCVTIDKTDTGAWMIPLKTSNSPQAIGFLFKGKKGQIINLENFHLGTNAKQSKVDNISVDVKKTLDNVVPKELNVLTHEGQKTVISAKKSGRFELPRKLVEKGPFRIWIDENNLAVFPTQGEWMDPAHLTEKLTIKQVVEFPIDSTKEHKKGSKRKKTPHTFSLWTGSRKLMKVQEFEGITFTNNHGKGDRDRFKENTNSCLRGAIFGGSYVEAAQTKIAEKPGILSEAFTGQILGRCVEFFTHARSVGRAENYINEAINLIKDYDIDFTIFSISRNEICQHHDGFYTQYSGRELMTPKDWRVINGKIVAPVAKENAKTFTPNKDAAKNAIKNCRYNEDTLDQVEKKNLEKLKQIENILKSEKQNLNVLFFNFKDVLAQNTELADKINQHCKTVDIQCSVMATPPTYKFDSLKGRFSPYLYRYKEDGHPNIRANQYISHSLTDILVEKYKK